MLAEHQSNNNLPGVLIEAAVTSVCAQIINMARGVVAGAKYKGVKFFEVSFGQNKWGVCYSVRY